MLRILLWASVGLLFRLNVQGGGNLPAEGPVILAANHRSYLDPVVLALASRRPVAYMAKAELFKIPLLGPLIRALYAFPVHRGAGDRAALRAAGEVLARGGVLGIFPEGTRQPGPGLGPAQPGAALLALKGSAPIVAAALVGTDRPFVRRVGLPWPGRIRVRMGAPIVPKEAPEDRRAERERLTAELMRSLAELGGFPK